ncbi:MAG TPA: SIS domain-containing protein [Rhizomicrobium sp.]|nr:SIS domain-containing protein [Rhizomicrobium sp.]
MTDAHAVANTKAGGTQMFAEAGEAPARIAAQLDANRTLVARLADRLRRLAPRAVLTAARGSSDNAATFARYLIETRAATLTSSYAPSVSSVYAAQPKLHDTVFVAISQSGRSPDLLAAVSAAKTAGAFTIALVNQEDSPLAALADDVVPLRAGAEKSVAATKTYLAANAAILQLVAEWREDAELKKALVSLPQNLAKAWSLDWQAPRLAEAKDLYVIGRGLGFGLAQEAALKFKETCGLHAEAFSAAEVRHGPMALVGPHFPALIFAQNDETRAGIESLARQFLAAGADVTAAGLEMPGAANLPVLDAHPALQPVLMAQSFYRLVASLSLARGYDPDRPPLLNKITETI